MKGSLRIIYEDKYIIVLHKPAGVATQTKNVAESDLCSYVKNYLNGGYVGLINRLDRQVEGLVLMAKSSSMAAILNRELTEHKMEKSYRARVYIDNANSNVITDSYVRLSDYIEVDKTKNMSRICDKTVFGGKKGELEYKMTDIETEDEYYIADVDIRLLTGRHHQIRLQLSNIGMPILGDLKYGSDKSVKYSKVHGMTDIQLCAYKLKFIHPSNGVELTFAI
ncbi:MAG: RNA pseudouridine synthase [Lachnospiraceae bacterium]|nr:RNA pseudouridine synthase [Lachnospiraceae bacterium]